MIPNLFRRDFIINNFNEEINKFSNCLNKTIIMSSKLFFKRDITRLKREYSYDNINNTINVDNILQYNEKEYSKVEDNILISKSMNSLTAIEKSVILLSFKDDLKRFEIAQKLNIRENRVSKIKTRALNKMKLYIKGDI